MSDERMNLPSASGIHRLVQCPASFLEAQKYPADMAGEAAEKGTRIHQYLEDASIHLDEEELELALSCKRLLSKTTEIWARKFNVITHEDLVKEERLFIRRGLSIVATGKPDIVIAGCDDNGENHLLVVDYKTGNQAPESAESNYQLRTLAVALAEKLEEDGIAWETISCAIVQPLVTWEPCVVTYTQEHIEKSKEELLDAIEFASSEQARKHPSVSACKYCRARLNCDALTGGLAPTQAISIPEIWLSKTPEQKAELWRQAKLAKSLVADIEKLVKADLLQGGEIPGLALKEGKTMRSLEAQNAFGVVSDMMTASEFAGCCKLSLTSFEKAFHNARCRQEGNAKLTKKSSKELLDARIEAIVKKTKSESTVVEGGVA